MIELALFVVLVGYDEPKVLEGSLFNEYDYEYAIEARRRGGKGKRDRRRGGGGLR